MARTIFYHIEKKTFDDNSNERLVRRSLILITKAIVYNFFKI